MKPILHIEVLQKWCSRVDKDRVLELVRPYLMSYVILCPGHTLASFDHCPFIKEHVELITFCEAESDSPVTAAEAELIIHVYKLDSSGVETMIDSGTDEKFPTAHVWPLPSQEFHGLWETLIYEDQIKQDTVRFIETAFEFADHGVDSNIIGWNRVILFHGPPGTGKTSLCRALAQKLSIRLADRFSQARLVEINAHALFSKWFAESGKSVSRLFEQLAEIMANPQMLVCVLVDEVESLAHARRASLSGLEPSDSIRAVNALLTQLDRLRFHPNVLVLTTSNVTGAIDVAFVDRADIKRRIGPPSARAVYMILRSCCNELMTCGLVTPRELLYELSALEAVRFTDIEPARPSLRLWDVACVAARHGLSGRALRRLPFIARALHLHRAKSLLTFLSALAAALNHYVADLAALDDGTPPQPSSG